MMSQQPNNFLPIQEISYNCIISKQGDCTIAFELFKPELFSLHAAEFERSHQSWVKAIGL